MKTIILIIIAIISSTAWAAFESPFESSIEALTIPNSHYVDSELVIRGQTPRNLEEYQPLKDLGVSKVLIFKNETKNEVQTEIQILNKLKIKSKHIEFPWKEIAHFIPVCEQAKAALKWIKANQELNETTFFHCTVGEDRTGLLAGLLLLSNDTNLSVKSVYKAELCAKGYEAGDPNKNANVAKTVRENLTPVFLKMAYLLKKAHNDANAINCNYDFDSDISFQKSIYAKNTSFRCGY
jgi:protein-tyrosine phosphatase